MLTEELYSLGSSAGFLSEKAMATHSSTLAWKLLWTEEPGRLQSVGSLGVGHLSAFTFFFLCVCVFFLFFN